VYADESDLFLSKKINLFLAYDDFSIEKNQKIYDLQNIVKIPHVPNTFPNMISV
jgi:hypothetical protein